MFFSAIATIAALYVEGAHLPCSFESWVIHAVIFTITFLCIFSLVTEWRKAPPVKRDNVILIAVSSMVVIIGIKDIYNGSLLTGSTLRQIVHISTLAIGIALLVVSLRRWKILKESPSFVGNK
jgi:uncharacterized membrane protein YjfL (UPF0719 family)